MKQVETVPPTTLYLPEIRKTLKVGLPVVASQLAYMSLGFLDTIMAGYLGAEDLGAIAIGRGLYMPLYIFIVGVILALTPIVAQFHGAKKPESVSKAFCQGLWLSSFFLFPAIFIVRHINDILYWAEVTPEIIPITDRYLDAISWGLPAAFAYLALRFFLDGVSITRPNMYFNIAAIPLNFIGNYAFMFGHFGFEKMGAAGAGYATAGVWWFMLIGLGIYILRSKKLSHLKLSVGYSMPDWHLIKEMLKIGVPNGISLAMEVSMFAIAALIIGTMGVVPIASHTIAINVAAIGFMLPLGFAIATTSRVGFEIGRQDFLRARMAGKIGIFIAFFSVCCVAVMLILFAENIARIYTNDMALVPLTTQLIFLAAVFLFPDGFQASGAGALRGLKDTKIPMIANAIAYLIIGLPVGYWFGVSLEFGAQGVWWGIILGLCFTAVFHPIRFFLLMKKRLVLRSLNG